MCHSSGHGAAGLHSGILLEVKSPGLKRGGDGAGGGRWGTKASSGLGLTSEISGVLLTGMVKGSGYKFTLYQHL